MMNPRASRALRRRAAKRRDLPHKMLKELNCMVTIMENLDSIQRLQNDVAHRQFLLLVKMHEEQEQ